MDKRKWCDEPIPKPWMGITSGHPNPDELSHHSQWNTNDDAEQNYQLGLSTDVHCRVILGCKMEPFVSGRLVTTKSISTYILRWRVIAFAMACPLPGALLRVQVVSGVPTWEVRWCEQM